MPWDQFSDECEGCRPAILNMETKKPLPLDSPEMQAINEIWDYDTTREQREAYHNFCCLNSRDPHDVELAQQIVSKIEKILREFC